MDTSSRLSRPTSSVRRISVSLFIGIFLYWFVQTAVERRIFGLVELFTLVSEGIFHPGKLAVLILCVATCLFLGLTALGQAFGARLNKAAEKDWVRWGLSLAVVALFFLWTLRITVLSFMTNDDTSLVRTLAGIPKWGLDYASSSFSNIYFCAFLSLFYRINPEGWWYTGYHLVAILVSCTIIGRCILLKTSRHAWPVLVGCLLHFFLCIGLFMYPLSQLSFTVTPAIVGSAAVALVLCRDETEKTSARILLDIVGILLMLLCYLHRADSGKALLCFWALAVLYQTVKTLLARDLQWKRQLLGLGACVLSLLVLLGATRTISHSESTYDADYWNAEYYRSMVMDYILEDLTAEELEVVGIPYELGLLLRQWYFMDERINTDTFSKLTDLYYTAPVQNAVEDTTTLIPTLLSGLTELFDSLSSGTIRPCTTILAVLFLLLSLLAFARYGRRYWLEFLCALCALGGALILCLYLVLEGRFLIRVFLVAFIPAVVSILLMALSVPHTTHNISRRCATLLRSLALILLAASYCVCVNAIKGVPYSDSATTREDVFNTQWQVESYANEHSDILFITNSFSQNLDPFHGGSYPTNYKLWGGTGVTAYSDRLYDDAFFRDDIRFMCENPGMIMFVLQYLSLDNGPVQAIQDAQLTSTIFVFDLDQVCPDSDYTGWHEQNGMTYYFENGQAVTGTRTIDGEEYEFFPSGAAAPMIRLENDGVIVYTTKAYSLMSSDS